MPPTTTTTSLESPSQTLSSRIRGSFYGLAVTDALGAPVEFKKRQTFPLVTTMLPNSNFHVHASLLYPDRAIDDEEYLPLPLGCFTDDTSMALCLAQSLLDCDGQSDEIHQIRNYLWWFRHGWMSSVGECFDVGEATSSALKQWAGLLKEYDAKFGESSNDTSTHTTKPPTTKSQNLSDSKIQHQQAMHAAVTTRLNVSHRSGNGSLMRVLPCALLFPSAPGVAARIAIHSSLPTHPHIRCQNSCEIYVHLVCAGLQGLSKTALASLVAQFIAEPSTTLDSEFQQRFSSYKTLADWSRKITEEIRSSGYVLDTLEAALWGFFTTNTFEEGAVKVVNLGDDADTVGAVYGGLAGAWYGVEAVPESWVEKMWRPGWEMVQDVVERIVQRSVEGSLGEMDGLCVGNP